MSKLHLATCSWKYDSWRGLIYPEKGQINYLEEYSRHFSSVEIDQWFWSLFGMDKIKLPGSQVVEEYFNSVPDDFKFTIKVPNSITLTHLYKKYQKKDGPLLVNPYFLSKDILRKFLKRISPLHKKIGLLMFQFEYLNKKKMPNLDYFIDKFSEFIQECPRDLPYGIEIRNPNYLKEEYFNFLNQQNLSHIFVQGYYMPSVVEIYHQFSKNIKNLTAFRLMGPDRKKIELQTGNHWNKVVVPRDKDLKEIIEIVKKLEQEQVEVFLNINNHFEGSAPLTIRRIQEIMQKQQIC